MKKILISIKPKWVKKILNGEKTLEIRKSFPKCELPCEVYIYCTKENAKYFIDNKIYNAMMNGKVVAKFTLNKVEEIRYRRHRTLDDFDGYYIDHGEKMNTSEIEIGEMACLSHAELNDYLKEQNGYAWHIDHLVPFDRPKELKEFFTRDKKGDIPVQVEELKGSKFMAFKRIEHAPQSYMFCEVYE